MRVAQRVAFFVADGLEELIDPDRSVDGETLAVEGWEGSRASGGREDGPEACYSHFAALEMVFGCTNECFEVEDSGLELEVGNSSSRRRERELRVNAKRRAHPVYTSRPWQLPPSVVRGLKASP